MRFSKPRKSDLVEKLANRAVYSPDFSVQKKAKVQELLCFQENKQLAYLKPIKLNHNMFNLSLEFEYARMGVPNNEWALTDLNLAFELCSTYPTHLYVPSRASKAVLQASALFRSRGRLPVLSYLHSNGASICRCAQPLTGLNARSNEDEQLMQLILETNAVNAGVMYVVDTRPKASCKHEANTNSR